MSALHRLDNLTPAGLVGTQGTWTFGAICFVDPAATCVAMRLQASERPTDTAERREFKN